MDRFDFTNVDRLIAGWVHSTIIPGAVLEIGMNGERVFSQAYGSYSDGNELKPIQSDTLFDAASLTKISCTLPAILLLASEGKLKLDDPVSDHITGFPHPGVTIRHLLRHSSGLSADLPYAKRSADRTVEDIMAQIMQQELRFAPGESVIYSDMGFILLGRIAEQAAGEPFGRFVRRRIHLPLGMKEAAFNPDEADVKRCAATEMVDGAYVIGQVHDEKAWHMGGVSGSAGLFATAEDFAVYANAWLCPEKQDVLPAPLMRECLREPWRGRGLGWEILHDPASPPTSAGRQWPAGSFGHTGFTGTSLWIDPVHKLSVVFLTNAVHYGRENRLRELRPLLHDTVLSSCTA